MVIPWPHIAHWSHGSMNSKWVYGNDVTQTWHVARGAHTAVTSSSRCAMWKPISCASISKHSKGLLAYGSESDSMQRTQPLEAHASSSKWMAVALRTRVALSSAELKASRFAILTM